jgi:hypothetical protein
MVHNMKHRHPFKLTIPVTPIIRLLPFVRCTHRLQFECLQTLRGGHGKDFRPDGEDALLGVLLPHGHGLDEFLGDGVLFVLFPGASPGGTTVGDSLLEGVLFGIPLEFAVNELERVQTRADVAVGLFAEKGEGAHVRAQTFP